MTNLYVSGSAWQEIKSRRTGSDPYYVQSFEAHPGRPNVPTNPYFKICLTFLDEASKTMFLLKYGEYL